MATFSQHLALASTFKDNNENKNRFSALKYALRMYLFHNNLLDEIESFFAENEFRKILMTLPRFKEDIYKQQLRRCFYKGSTNTERLFFMRSHFTLLERLHNTDTLIGFYTEQVQPITFIANAKQFSCRISYHHDVIREGYLWLTMEMDGEILLKIIFWLMEYQGEPSLCVSTIQGGKNTLEANRLFTKTFWGLRPQNMGMQLLRWYAETLGIQQIITFEIDNIWSKKIIDRKAIADFLQEQGAQPIKNTPYLKLAAITPRKDLSEVPSKKRSLYRSRFEFLDQSGIHAKTLFSTYLITKNSSDNKNDSSH